jgi:hypothetical protein
VSEQVVVDRRVLATVVWHPRALARPPRRARATPAASNTRGTIRGTAIGLALLFLLELHVHDLIVPASVESETVRAVHAWLRR